MNMNTTNTTRLKEDTTQKGQTESIQTNTIDPPTMIDIRYTLIAVGSIACLFIILLIFKARKRIWKGLHKPVEKWKREKLIKSIARGFSGIDHKNNSTRHSCIDVISCESPNEYTMHGQLSTQDIDSLHNTTRHSIHSIHSIQSNHSIQSTQSIRSAKSSLVTNEYLIKPPFVERAVLASKRLSRKIFHPFHPKTIGDSRTSSKYFYDESQMYSLDQSEKMTTISSELSTMEYIIEESLFNIPNVSTENSIATSFEPSVMTERKSIMICYQSPFDSAELFKEDLD